MTVRNHPAGSRAAARRVRPVVFVTLGRGLSVAVVGRAHVATTGCVVAGQGMGT
jgi:hypothetical protein